MKIREHKGFGIYILEESAGFYAEIYRKDRLLKTIRSEERNLGEEPFRSVSLALKAAKEWIDQTYSKRIKYKGFIQASLPGYRGKN